MGQRQQQLTQIAGFPGFRVEGSWFEDQRGERVTILPVQRVSFTCRLVLAMKRQWAPRCANCFAVCRSRGEEKTAVRRWFDLPWGTHPVVLQYVPKRVRCTRCDRRGVELLPWADPKQRQTRRFQQMVALDAFSMPLLHVATKYGISWHTVRRAETDAIARWQQTREPSPLRMVGIDEKWLGRRHKAEHKFVTIVSNLETGEPLWIGYGRDEATVAKWIATLSPETRAAIVLVACDMHRAFLNAIRAEPSLAHVLVVHDQFHIMKRAGEAITELRREVFFRAGAQTRAIGRGARWLVLRAWERTSQEDRARLRALFTLNGKLARAYQVVEEIRQALKAPDEDAIAAALHHVLLRTEKRANVPMRKLHDSIEAHFAEIIALGRHHPPTGRIEALNNNWEALVRRGRGYRDHAYLLAKLRFMTVNPVRTRDGLKRFAALGIDAPTKAAA